MGVSCVLREVKMDEYCLGGDGEPNVTQSTRPYAMVRSSRCSFGVWVALRTAVDASHAGLDEAARRHPEPRRGRSVVGGRVRVVGATRAPHSAPRRCSDAAATRAVNAAAAAECSVATSPSWMDRRWTDP